MAKRSPHLRVQFQSASCTMFMVGCSMKCPLCGVTVELELVEGRTELKASDELFDAA